MNYLHYYPTDFINGEGVRCTLFVAGCEHLCKGCHNPVSWNPKAGRLFDQSMEDRIIADLNDVQVCRHGLSLSGGDPLHPVNLEAVGRLVKRVSAECAGKTVWLWTGYLFEQLDDRQREITDYIDVLIDGPFDLEKRTPALAWRGSTNQRVIPLRNSPAISSRHSKTPTRLP